MRNLGLAAVLAFSLSGAVQAQQLKPMADGTFDGIPFDQALSTMHVLGKWLLPEHGTVQIFSMNGSNDPLTRCLGAEIDAEDCVTSRLYVAMKDESVESTDLSLAVGDSTYALLRGVNGMGWHLPEGELLKNVSNDRFSLRICGSEFTTKLSGGAVIPTAYTLFINREEKNKRYSFSATMERNKDGRSVFDNCGPSQMLERDEGFITGRRAKKVETAPR